MAALRRMSATSIGGMFRKNEPLTLSKGSILCITMMQKGCAKYIPKEKDAPKVIAWRYFSSVCFFMLLASKNAAAAGKKWKGDRWLRKNFNGAPFAIERQ